MNDITLNLKVVIAVTAAHCGIDNACKAASARECDFVVCFKSIEDKIAGCSEKFDFIDPGRPNKRIRSAAGALNSLESQGCLVVKVGGI